MKEKVVVFAGEDKFIKPRNRSYNVAKNYSNLVGDGNPPVDTGLGRELTTQYQGGSGGSGGGGGNYLGGGGETSTLQPIEYTTIYQLPNTTIQPAPTTIQPAPTTIQPAPTTIQPAPTTILPTVAIPFITPTGFGVAPMGRSGGGGGGGGGEDKKEDKKNYWWLLLVLGLGAGLYIFKKKKK